MFCVLYHANNMVPRYQSYILLGIVWYLWYHHTGESLLLLIFFSRRSSSQLEL